jgi:serine/threonine-protein kinase
MFLGSFSGGGVPAAFRATGKATKMGDAKRFGRYEVCDTIGRGAMGVVYLAEDPVIGRKVAIKVVEAHTGLEKDELVQLQARFEREFQSAGRLSHPNIVGVHDVGQEEGATFIAMEYVQGESLASVLAENRAFSFKEIADLAAQLCSGLDYAHEFGIVHRDIKPANILITRDGRPKITDFGVAKVATTTLTRTGTVVGTPAYMSPEQVTGHPVEGTADQFSLAVMIYQMLTGERPFTGENPTTIMYKIVHEQPVPPSVLNAMVPGPVDDGLIRALAKNPQERYATCMELADALRGALGAAPGDATVVMSTGQTEATVVDPSLRGAQPQPDATGKGQGMRVVGLAAAGVAVVGLAIAAWAYSIGAFGGAGEGSGTPEDVSTEPPAALTHPLRIQAGEGWQVWVNGNDTGVVTPGSVDLSGAAGEEVTVELRFGDLAPVAATFTLGDGLPGTWEPEDAAMATAALVEEDAAEEPPPAEPPVAFTIVSVPVGVRVTFDGEILNDRTPADVDIDLAESHSVTIELEDYSSESWTFDRDALSDAQVESRELRFNLTPAIAPGFVKIDNPSYAVEVRVTPVGGTPGQELNLGASNLHEIRLTPGRYAINASAPSVYWTGQRRTVTVVSEETLSITWLPRAVTVQVSAVPGNCVVSIDGVEVGSPPFPQLLISIGPHTFNFDWTAMGRGTKEETVRVRTNNQRIVGQPIGKP